MMALVRCGLYGIANVIPPISPCPDNSPCVSDEVFAMPSRNLAI